LVLRNVIKIVAIECFKAEMHQIRFRLGSAPDPSGRAYSAPTDPLARFKGPTTKEREGRKDGKKGKGGEKGTYFEGEERGREEEKGKGGRRRDRGILCTCKTLPQTHTWWADADCPLPKNPIPFGPRASPYIGPRP